MIARIKSPRGVGKGLNNRLFGEHLRSLLPYNAYLSTMIQPVPRVNSKRSRILDVWATVWAASHNAVVNIELACVQAWWVLRPLTTGHRTNIHTSIPNH